jgi:hypothetical protein
MDSSPDLLGAVMTIRFLNYLKFKKMDHVIKAEQAGFYLKCSKKDNSGN